MRVHIYAVRVEYYFFLVVAVAYQNSNLDEPHFVHLSLCRLAHILHTSRVVSKTKAEQIFRSCVCCCVHYQALEKKNARAHCGSYIPIFTQTTNGHIFGYYIKLCWLCDSYRAWLKIFILPDNAYSCIYSIWFQYTVSSTATAAIVPIPVTALLSKLW